MATHATTWFGVLSSSLSALAVGYAVVYDDTGKFRPATTANRSSYGRSVGVSISAASATNTSFEYQVAGVLPASVTGLGAGSASWVRASATGTLERCTPGAGDDLLGKCNTAGDLQVCPGVWDSDNASGGGGGGGGDASYPIDLTDGAEVDVPAAGVVTSNGTALGSAATLTHEMGGLEADVSAYSGLVKIASGATSAVSLGSGVETFLGTPSSANLAAALTDETGSGAAVFATSPTLVTPALGAATGSSVALSSYWSTGATPATSGEGRMSQNTGIYYRNDTNDGNIRAVYLAGNELSIGSSLAGGTATTRIYSTSTVETHGDTLTFVDSTGGDTRANITGSSVQLYKPLRLIDSGGDHSYVFTPSDLAADRNVTLPLLTGTDTFVFQSHTQTLANKTFSDAVSIGTGTLATTGTGLRLGGTAATNRIVWHDGTADRALLITETGGNGVQFGSTSHVVGYYGSSVTVGAMSSALFLYGGGAERLRVEASGVSLVGGAGSYGSGDKVAFVLNAATNPSTNPTGGGILYADAGAGKWRGSGGTVTTFGPADPHCPTCGRDFAVEHQNDELGEHLALCLPCLVDALASRGVDTSKFTITDKRATTKQQWDDHHAAVKERERAAREPKPEPAPES